MKSFHYICLYLICYVSFSFITLNGNDLSINKYTNNGELAQIIYASKAVDKSIPTIAFTYNDTNVIAICLRYKDNPFQSSYVEHVDILGNGQIVLISIGYIPDIKSLKSYANLITQSHILMYGEVPSIDYYSKKISLWLTRGLYPADDENNYLSRPMAVSALLLSYDEDRQLSRMNFVQNSGYTEETTIALLGSISSTTKDSLTKIIKSKNDSIANKINKIIDTILNNIETMNDVNSDDINRICYDCVMKNNANILRYKSNLSKDELLHYIKSIDLGNLSDKSTE